MKNKDIEKKIVSSLEDDTNLSSDVLIAAKQEMRARRPVKKKVYMRYAVAACVAVVVCLAIVLPIAIMHTSVKSIEYTSMQDYFLQQDITIKTYDEIFEIDVAGPSNTGSGNDMTSGIFPYAKIKCELLRYKSQDFCIKETYKYTNGDIIENYVVINNIENLENSYFSDFTKLDKSIIEKDVEIVYSYDTVSQTGKAKLKYGGFDFYLSVGAQTEDYMIFHLKQFIRLQKI